MAKGESRYFAYRVRQMERTRRMRMVCVRRMRRRRGRVRGGEVETVYSTVVGEGRRVRR